MPSVTGSAEVLAIIQEEQTSPVPSIKLRSGSKKELQTTQAPQEEKKCKCVAPNQPGQKCFVTPGPNRDDPSIDQFLKERESQLRNEYDKLLDKKISMARERFNFILQNEQLRACYMLREAHRERQEKVKALESQLECKNLAALMFVMCTERTRSKLEKRRLIEDYTNYINGLQDLLTDAQQLILHLSRGYKTAARVDYEWREKMNTIVGELMKFIYNFAGGPQETNQYFLDLPNLLKTEAPIVDDPDEDPCQSEEVEEEEEAYSPEEEGEKPWWDALESNDRPFVVFGDMADFKPPQRRQVLNTIKAVKAAKTAPQIWKKYVFNEIILKKSCENVEDIKDVYPHLKRESDISERTQDSLPLEKAFAAYSKLSVASRRATAVSLDGKGIDMGSLLKIITSTGAPKSSKSTDKSALLGAKDSIEIHSSTRLKHMNAKSEANQKKEAVVLEIGKRYSIGEIHEQDVMEDESKEINTQRENEEQKGLDDPSVPSGLGSAHHDSLEVIPTHKPDKDHIINDERYCPVEKCQLLQVDSFTRSLPPYMRASPFSQFQQTYEEYETCSPEQLEILKQRLEAKRTADEPYEDSREPSQEASVEGGIGTQTSFDGIDAPCTCTENMSATSAHSDFIFDLRDLIPIKKAIDTIRKECLFDDTIDFDRFKVVGQESDQTTSDKPTKVPQKEFTQARQLSITKILHQHPSLLDIFQANTKC